MASASVHHIKAMTLLVLIDPPSPFDTLAT